MATSTITVRGVELVRDSKAPSTAPWRCKRCKAESPTFDTSPAGCEAFIAWAGGHHHEGEAR
jgi:hypothetical protein